MYCVSCGTELSDDAAFCLRCGKPQRGDGASVDDNASIEETNGDTRWETCRISFGKTGLAERGFVAVINTPGGTFHVLDARRRGITTDSYGPLRKATDTSASYNGLVQRLVREGWEPTGSDSHWWEERFRRPATTRTVERCEIVLRGRRFLADAIGPAGQYDAARTEKLQGMTERRKLEGGRDAHSALVAGLEQHGWQKVADYGLGWWELSFERPLSHASAGTPAVPG
jgi:hypothetical protein